MRVRGGSRRLHAGIRPRGLDGWIQHAVRGYVEGAALPGDPEDPSETRTRAARPRPGSTRNSDTHPSGRAYPGAVWHGARRVVGAWTASPLAASAAPRRHRLLQTAAGGDRPLVPRPGSSQTKAPGGGRAGGSAPSPPRAQRARARCRRISDLLGGLRVGGAPAEGCERRDARGLRHERSGRLRRRD